MRRRDRAEALHVGAAVVVVAMDAINFRQVDTRRRERSFDEDSDPGGSRNGSTGMRW